MYHTLPTLLLTFLFLSVSPVHGSLYVINPRTGATCHGSKPCTVQWLDDGIVPLLSNIGACTVGLYTGQQKLVQTIKAVDVSSTQSLKFTPDPKAGPNMDSYYIAFTSTTLKDTNGSSPYLAYSPPFRLENMSGSLSSPVPSDTSTKSIPSSVAHASSNVVASTSTVGTLSTSISSSSTASTTSGFSTATSNAASASSSGSSPAGSSSNSNSSSRTSAISPLLYLASFAPIGFVLVTALGYL